MPQPLKPGMQRTWMVSEHLPISSFSSEFSAWQKQTAIPTFGLVIAYLIPGFLALCELSPYSPTAQAWLGALPENSPTVGGFLYVTIASVTSGLIVSTLRWLLLDQVHSRTGLSPPPLDFSKLQENIDAFHAAVDYHYRYYQFYGNTLISLVAISAGRWPVWNLVPGLPPCVVAFGLLFLLTLFFFASRDSLSKYYARLSVLQKPASS